MAQRAGDTFGMLALSCCPSSVTVLMLWSVPMLLLEC